MLRRIITLISVALIATVSAEEKTDKLDKIQKTLDNIISKAGIQFDGEFRSQYTPSKIDGTLASEADRQTESNEYTSVDFDIKARPNEMVTARAMFRLHQNWQNFFSDVSNPIFTRWLSIDGNVKDMLFFSAGDFKEKISPLTLYTPEISILNEPYVFARQRQLAQDEVFVGGNNRVLQGINLKFEAEIAPVFNEFHVSLIGSRLRNIETNINNGNKVTATIQKSDFAKYFVGGNLDMTFLKGINLGATDLFIFDQENSYRGSDTTAQILAQRTNVFSVRPGVDIDGMLDNEELTLNVKAECAFSSDDSTSFDTVSVLNGVVEKDFNSTKINGSAINVGADIGYAFGEMVGVMLKGAFIMNEKYFRNELAQSPSFYGDRIMNNENSYKDTVNMYNTFDALYHSVFKFCPSSSTNRWDKAPFTKTSYWRSIQTQDELAKLVAKGYFDDALQLIYPFGMATPNRVGIDTKLNITALKDGIKADLLFVSLSENTADTLKTVEQAKTTFTQVGGGLKVDISKFVPAIKYPLEISGSFVTSGAKTPEKDTVVSSEIQSNFINAGLYYKFFKRAAVMVGYQIIKNTYSAANTVTTEVTLDNWAVGTEWSINDGASVVASVGEMSRKNDAVGDVYQTVADVSLRVKF